MCGICGFAGSGTLDDLNQIMKPLLHRGPDAQGTWNNSRNVFLGHTRLSIIDLKNGSQPMLSADEKVVISYNGEIYNSSELRKELESKGYAFKSLHSDTEVIINGYLAWGENIVQKLNGMWAFVIYDSRKQTLFLSRDRFGEKPLFYCNKNGTFIFASELSSFECFPTFDREISKIALGKYLAHGYIPAPHSLLKDVYKLNAGSNLTFSLSTNQIRINRYWEFVLDPEPLGKRNENYYAEGVLSLLDESVRARMVSDVPIGTFLSGGIDSSTITRLAKNSVSNLESFNIGFEDETFDESTFAKEAADFIGTDHYTELCSESKMLEVCQILPKILDEPISDSSIIATFQLCKFARKRVKVAIGGDGADELFAGYDPFKAIRTASFFEQFGGRMLSSSLLGLANYLLPVSHNNISFDFKVKRFLKGMTCPWAYRNPAWLAPCSIKDVNDVLGLNFSGEEIYSEAIEFWNNCPRDNPLDKTLNFYTNIYLQNGILTKLDRSSMLNSLEVRSPFLDFKLVDFIRKIPCQLKLHAGTSKYILKKAVSGILPASILNRKKKGFGTPIGQWIKQDRLKIIPNLDITSVLLKEHRNNKKDHRLAIYADFMLNQKIN